MLGGLSTMAHFYIHHSPVLHLNNYTATCICTLCALACMYTLDMLYSKTKSWMIKWCFMTAERQLDIWAHCDSTRHFIVWHIICFCALKLCMPSIFAQALQQFIFYIFLTCIWLKPRPQPPWSICDHEGWAQSASVTLRSWHPGQLCRPPIQTNRREGIDIHVHVRRHELLSFTFVVTLRYEGIKGHNII